MTPQWFSHQSWGSTVTCQLSSHWANSEFFGFSLCAVIAFRSFSHCLQVKCTYHFSNEHGDSHDLYCYLHDWYDEKRIDSDHIVVGFDPCLVAKEDYMFSECSEVSVEFQPEDMNGNLLPLDFCQVHKCGLRLLDAKDKHGPVTRFQAKRARFQANIARFQAKRAKLRKKRTSFNNYFDKDIVGRIAAESKKILI